MNTPDTTFERRAVRPAECFREGWQLIRDDYWLFFGICVVGILVGSVAPLGILMGPAMCGIHLCLLRRAAGRRVKFDMLFKGFDYFVESLIATLIMVVPMFVLMTFFQVAMIIVFFTLVPLQPGQAPDASVWWTVGGLWLGMFLVLMVFALVYSILLFFVYPLIVDRKLRGVAAVQTSIKAGWANLGGLLGLALLNMALGVAGLLACYIGSLFLMPVSLAAHMVAYRQVFPAEQAILLTPADAEPGR